MPSINTSIMAPSTTLTTDSATSDPDRITLRTEVGDAVILEVETVPHANTPYQVADGFFTPEVALYGGC